jgi:hypothetical protein
MSRLKHIVDKLLEAEKAAQADAHGSESNLASDPLRYMRVAGLTRLQAMQKAIDLLTEHQPKDWEQKVEQIRAAMA